MKLPAASVQWTGAQQQCARQLLTDCLCMLAGANEANPSAEKRAKIDELNVALGLPAARWPAERVAA